MRVWVKSALCGEVQELGFQGKSGSFLFVSGDERLVIKTISVTESKYLRKILLAYYEHTTHPTYLSAASFGLWLR
jgi:hypothetical protein